MARAEDLKAEQRAQWTAAARGWEDNAAWLEEQLGAVSRWLCDAAKLAPGHHVLDIACGVGEPSSTAAARVLPGGKVVATDLSSAMVGAARRAHQRLGFEHVEAQVMDAERIEMSSESFDAVTCRFGLMFCPEPSRAAAEMHRVLKPGGRLAVAVWDVPAKNPFFTGIGEIVAKYAALPPPDPKAPGVFRLAAPGELATLLQTVGFEQVRVESLPVTIRFATPEAYWDVQSQMAAPLKAAVAKLPADKVAELREAVIAVARANIVGEEVQLQATPLVAVATRGA